MPLARAGLSQEEHHDYMLQNLEDYDKAIHIWETGVAKGYLPFQALLDAKDAAVMVHLNALDSGNQEMADKSAAAIDSIDEILIRFLGASRVSGSSCQRWWNKVCPSCRELSGGSIYYRDQMRK